MLSGLNIPMIIERSFSTKDGIPDWEIVHDPIIQNIVVRYNSNCFSNPREIDHLTSCLQKQMHELRRRLSPGSIYDEKS